MTRPAACHVGGRSWERLDLPPLLEPGGAGGDWTAQVVGTPYAVALPARRPHSPTNASRTSARPSPSAPLPSLPSLPPASRPPARAPPRQ